MVFFYCDFIVVWFVGCVCECVDYVVWCVGVGCVDVDFWWYDGGDGVGVLG